MIKYVRDYESLRWDTAPWTPECISMTFSQRQSRPPPDQLYALRQMINFGVGKVKEGVCDVIEFDCMQFEADYINSFMKENHSEIIYVFKGCWRPSCEPPTTLEKGIV